MTMYNPWSRYRVIWSEFDRRARIVTKRRSFRTREARDAFADRVRGKENYWQMIEC